MLSIGIIKMNDIKINSSKSNIKEQIEDIIEDDSIFKIHKVKSAQEIQEFAHFTLNPDKKFAVTQHNFYEKKNYFYSAFYVDYEDTPDPQNEENQKNAKLNIFGSCIVAGMVVSDLYIVKNKLTYTINDNNKIKADYEYTNFELYELIDVLTNLFYLNGVCINENGEMKQYKYTENPLISLNNIHEYIYHEYEIYTKILMVIVNTTEKDNKLNEKATLIAGHPVRGTVYFGLYNKSQSITEKYSPYINLSIEMLNNILSIRSRDINLTINHTQGDNEYINFEKLLELEEARHSTKSINDPAKFIGTLLNIKE